MTNDSTFNSKDTGDATEAKIIYRLIEHGYEIALPFGDNSKYDLIVDDDGKIYRIQCKTAWTAENGRMLFNTHSQTTREGEYYESGYDGEIDAFLVRYPENGKLYWIDIEEAPDRRMGLRFDSEIRHPSIKWADNYEFDGRIP